MRRFRLGSGRELTEHLIEVLGVDARVAGVLLDHLEARPRLAADEERLRASGEER